MTVPAARFKDLVEMIVGDWLTRELANIPPGPDRLPRLHDQQA